MGLDEISICWERGGDFFGKGVAVFTYEFNDKKNQVYQQKIFFSVITKSLNRGILTKNLVTFRRWDEVKDEKFGGRGGGGSSREANI